MLFAEARLEGVGALHNCLEVVVGRLGVRIEEERRVRRRLARGLISADSNHEL